MLTSQFEVLYLILATAPLLLFYSIKLFFHTQKEPYTLTINLLSVVTRIRGRAICVVRLGAVLYSEIVCFESHLFLISYWRSIIEMVLWGGGLIC